MADKSSSSLSETDKQSSDTSNSGMLQSGASPEELTYLDYSKRWITAVNRGGLFEVNDETYKLFVDLEMKVRKFLPQLMKPGSAALNKELVVKEITSDDDILFSWMVATSGFDDEELSSELLSMITESWLTIRGFSVAGAWMEYYKQCKDSNTKKEHALRKNLKRKRIASEMELEDETA